MKQKLYLLLLLVVMLAGCNTKPENLGDIASEYANVNDSVRVHYKKYGDGNKTICFVHGFGCDLNTWEKQFRGLSEDSNLRLLFIDLPGYGESSKPHVEYTLDFFAKAVNAVLDKEHTGAIVLVGHSLGTPVCRQVLMSGRQGDLVDIDGVYCFYDGTETYVPWSAFESLACWYYCKIAGHKTADYLAFGEADVQTFCQIFDRLSKGGISDPAELYRKGIMEYLR